jgi:hypothetical protein
MEPEQVWRNDMWQAAGRAGPQRWPVKLSVAVVMSLCVAAWVVLAGILHICLSALS